MTTKRLLILAAASALALGGLSGCATNFRADVSRFQQMPPAQGQSFTVMPDDNALAGSLEFAHYADLVAERLTQQGYVRAADPAAAQLVVRLAYDVDRGTQRVRYSGFGPDPFFYDPFYYGGPWRGWRGRYMMGWYDAYPWGWGGRGGNLDSYVIYQSQLSMTIDRAEGGERLFEGTAKAQSVSSKLTYLVPNLIDALFTDFPGHNGEEVRVTVAPEPRN